MLEALKGIFSPLDEPQRAPEAGYEPIGDGDEAFEPNGSPRSKVGTESGPAVYRCFWILGAGVLLSWNVLVCTIPLLSSFFPEESRMRDLLASWLSTTYCFGNLFFLGLAQRGVGKTSPSPRLHQSLLLLLVLSVLLTFPLLPLLLPSLSPSSPFLLPLLILVTLLLSISTALLQSSVFALASLWGSTAMLAVMSGQGGIAVLVSGVQLILAVISALRQGGGANDDGAPSNLAGVGLWAMGALGAFGCLLAHRHLMQHADYSSVLAPMFIRNQRQDAGKGSRGKTLRVLKKNLGVEGAVAWVFVVTLSVFPPVTMSILSTADPVPRLLQPAVFLPLHFLLFNVGDYIGRTYVPAIPALLFTSQPFILLLSFCRTFFIPLFLICNVSPRSSPPLVNSDLLYFVIILFFGATNGYVSSLSMIVSSSAALNPRIDEEEKDVAGTLAAFCLVAGLAGGSLSSFAVGALVRDHV